MGDWRFIAKGKQRNCSVRDGLVLWERKRVFGEDMLTINETE
jgi:Zn ribbon nucleic-acid-binding protein